MTLRLRSFGWLWTLSAFVAGLVAAGMWFTSAQAWNRYQTAAFVAGFTIYEDLRTGMAPPPGLLINPLPTEAAALADSGAFQQMPGFADRRFVTNLSILTDSSAPLSGRELTLAVLSDRLVYPVSDIVSGSDQTGPEKMGNLTRLLATYCSEPILIAQFGRGVWQQVDGTAIWGCKAAPVDLRLPAILLGIVSLAVLLTSVGNVSDSFARFAQALGDRRRRGGPQSYDADGPEELRDIVTAVNDHLDAERAQLEKRAIVLSGVSHDLGTPATRVRLRAALIPDGELREKLEADVDQMTGMIESVLTYTRSELSVEEPRQISLTSLVESLVADYQDMDRPVSLKAVDPVVVESASSVFMSRRGHASLPETRRILVTGQPIALKRALSNLIDNALKYGRHAEVELETDAQTATIVVEDKGTDLSVADIEALLAPFQRGSNIGSSDGFGLGLTIVSTVAEQHGGTLSFEAGDQGLRARLQITRQ
ncbi:HAMP domain-containing histidine kinase [Ruegeria sp. SCSIO 43209]|uniref:sensor histidine kinase n=1 Tax=Ruegeria sp. SCSIO 43209 TaxID=2793010 RepID=UPI001CAA0263|nr:HAMP domain-containing sensor histidine kinase [Ruegeria sp. SCSIO 43209]UAB88606.1 HAMP domain-containing histidine kinase [Ruegeria sp. SCSIO 43209]